jgi:hypothetical protein
LRSAEKTEGTAACGSFDIAYYTYKILFFFCKTDDNGDELQTTTGSFVYRTSSLVETFQFSAKIRDDKMSGITKEDLRERKRERKREIKLITKTVLIFIFLHSKFNSEF